MAEPNAAQGKPILITGAHRTGTTWVGKMLAAGGQAAYISEPLNVWHRPGVLSTPVRYWYTYICAENESCYLPAFRQLLDYRYHLLPEIRSLRSAKDFLRMGRDWGIFLAGRAGKKRPLLKDPFAVFSIPWFIDRLDCQVVVTIRHPAAFASSLKRLHWPFQLKDLLSQPLLMRDWLEPYHPELERMVSSPGDIIAQSSLLWRIIYQVIAVFREQHPQIRVVRHEDLSADPGQGFRALYSALGLNFSSQAHERILAASSAENPGELSGKRVHAYRLDSRANLDNWKRRLQPEEVRRIRQLTEEVAATYYPEQGWA